MTGRSSVVSSVVAAALAVLLGAAVGFVLTFAHRQFPVVLLGVPVPLGLLGALAAVAALLAVLAAALAVGLVVLEGLWGPLPAVVLLLLWLAEDVADWVCDRLVVTDKRIYRRYGVVTGHSPSISLMAVAYLDAAVPPLGRLLHYGTLRLDSAAQNDAPLSRFDLVPDVVEVSHEILRLRTKAMPKYPQA